MRLDSGMVKILDFGVARAGAGPITRVGDIVGTLNYMSPEQLTGEPVDHRTDVYAVGALAYSSSRTAWRFRGRLTPASCTEFSQWVRCQSTIWCRASIRTSSRLSSGPWRARPMRVIRTWRPCARTSRSCAPVCPKRRRTSTIQSPPIPRPRRESTPDEAVLVLNRDHRPAGARRSLEPWDPLCRNRRQAWRRSPAGRGPVLLAVACAALTGALIATFMVNDPSVVSPPVQVDSPDVARPPAPQPPAAADAPPKETAAATATELDEQLRSTRETVRREMLAGERQRALDALIRGLALDAKDPALNSLAEDLAGAARRTAMDARGAASARHADPDIISRISQRANPGARGRESHAHGRSNSRDSSVLGVCGALQQDSRCSRPALVCGSTAEASHGRRCGAFVAQAE